jgi:adenine/guanine/hypoxanthine permease
MAYIVVLNPIILTGANEAVTDGPPLDFLQVTFATAGVAAVMSILMGVVGKMPIAMAAGLGLNGVVAFQLAPQMGWEGAMGVVVVEGALAVLLVATGVRTALFDAIPAALKHAIAVGIGLFLVLIGLVDAGFARRIPGETGTVPLQLGIANRLDGWPIVVFCVTLAVMLVLHVRGTKGALLIGILFGTVLSIVLESIVEVGPAMGDPNSTGWALNVPKLPDNWADAPDLGLLGNFDIPHAIDAVGWTAFIVFTLSLFLTDFFDTMGTSVAIAEQGGLVDEDGRPKNITPLLFVDSFGAVAGGVSSTSTATSYIESGAGVADGARTGLASVVTGLCFLVAMFFSPLVAVIPSEAAAPALVVVGLIMFKQITNISWEDDLEVAAAAFLAMVLMPFTFSITVGVGIGFITYTLLKVARGRWHQVHPLLFVTSALFGAYFFLNPIEGWLGIS